MVLFDSINRLATTAGPGSRRRLFVPPSTNAPLFHYGDGDERSFLSLIENGSLFEDDSDAASVSTSRSLPSTLSSARTDDQESFHSWLLEEQHRRYSATNSEEDSLHSPAKLSSHLLTASSFNPYEDFTGLRTTYRIELYMLFKYALPLLITYVLEHFFSIICLLVVGHLGKNQLAAVSLGSMCSAISFAVFEGIATALDTQCPQAYGAGNYHLVSVHVQRCFFVSCLLYVPVAIAWWYSGFWLRFIIDSQEVLELTTLFLRVMVFGGPAYIFFEDAKRFLQAQGIFEAGTGVLFLSAPINIALSYFLVWNETFGIGYVGAPVAAVINFWLMSVLLVLYVVFIDGRKCWFGLAPAHQLFDQWGALCHLAIPGVVMLESESLAYEIMTVIASYFGTAQLAAQSAVATIVSLAYMIPFAFSIASLTRIANFIGGQNIAAAQKATSTGLWLAVLVSLVNGLVLFGFRKQISTLFTQDPEVSQLIVDIINPLVAIVTVFDGITAVASGILRAQGSQKIGGIINFLAYYAFAMPLALVLCKYTDLQLYGLWIGVGSGILMIGAAEILVILVTDWDSVMVRAGLFADDSSI